MFKSVKETAQETGLSTKFLYTECAAGRIPCIKTGVKFLLDPEQVIAHLHKQAAEAVKEAETS